MAFKDRYSRIYVFGETHSNIKEVKRIQKEVIKLKPDIIIHELDWEDKDFYKKHLPNTKVLPLEPSNIEGRILPKNLKEQFKIREKEMLSSLNKLPSNKKIAVIIGDTHIRTIDGGLGRPILSNYFKKNNALINRSLKGEIK